MQYFMGDYLIKNVNVDPRLQGCHLGKRKLCASVIYLYDLSLVVAVVSAEYRAHWVSLLLGDGWNQMQLKHLFIFNPPRLIV